MVTNQDKKTLLGTTKKPFAKLQLLLIAAVLVVSGVYLVTRLYAASGSITLLSSVSTSLNIGDTVTITVRENSSTDAVNAVQANIAYDATRLQYVSVDDTGTAFGVAALTQASGGVLQIARGVSGGTAPVTGDQLVTKVTFKALAGGSVPLTIAAGSALVRESDTVDILAVKNGVTLTLADLAAPSVPAGLTNAAPGMTSISLTWTASTDNVGVAGYRVYRNGTQVATPTTPNFNDTGLTPNTAYSYKVAAYDAANNASAQSTALVVTTAPDTAAPTVPGTPTSSTQTMTSITLSWAASTDNVAVTGYRVYRNGTQVATPTTTSYTDTGLAVNTTYTYTIAAVDAAGNASAQSTGAAIKTLADTQAPTVPTGVSGTVTGLNVALTWTASTDNVAVTSYVIYRDGAQIATSTTNSYTVTSAPTGAHTYSVAARDAAGNTSAQSTATSISVFIVGDINRDTKVDVFDLSTLLTNWGRTGANTSDLNGDSVVNIFDLSILLSHWTG